MLTSLTTRSMTRSMTGTSTSSTSAGRLLAGRARGLLGAFAATSAAHLGALLTDSKALELVTKPALMPLLAAHVLSTRGPGARTRRSGVDQLNTPAGATLPEEPAADAPHPRRAARLLVPALLASAAGDALLQADSEAAFLAGMGAFAAAHVCYVTMFAQQGALTDRRRAALVSAAYATAWVVLISQLWPGLGALQIPVAGYSLLLASTAVTSAGLGLRAGLGGGLFLLSDTLIATRIAGWRELPGHEFWIMSTYVAAQYLLATAALKAEEQAEAQA
ncbi:putative membrane protein YhhN [Kitasatospora sp. MAP12-15]|uniref:lysoplasmalogenase n=1 Tax=unclassified Kitasatospora TaxID=2633591 RepID=UPI0024749CEE|nr:lysoplasmalogenase [Kitasatospora sp. MAP12-44]MDH6114144.1 putative membrane protein YhhN [Kitasatospora sp. MAP12-44]